MSKEKVGIIGAGSWGMALAYLMSNNGHDVTVWSRTKENVEILSREHENKEKLPGVILPDDVKFTFDLIEAIKDKKIIVVIQ